MATKVKKFSVETGTKFDPDSNPAIYIDGVMSTEWTNNSVTEVTPGEDVSMYNDTYTLEVPTNATQFLVFIGEDKELGVFLDDNNQAVSKGYMLYNSIENWIAFDVDYNNTSSGGGLG